MELRSKGFTRVVMSLSRAKASHPGVALGPRDGLNAVPGGRIVRAPGSVTFIDCIAPLWRVRGPSRVNAMNAITAMSLCLKEIDETCNLSQMLSVYFEYE